MQHEICTSMQVARSGACKCGSTSAIEPSYREIFCMLGQGNPGIDFGFVKVPCSACTAWDMLVCHQCHSFGLTTQYSPTHILLLTSGWHHTQANFWKKPCTQTGLGLLTLAARMRPLWDVSTPTMCSSPKGCSRIASSKLPDPHPKSTCLYPIRSCLTILSG